MRTSLIIFLGLAFGAVLSTNVQAEPNDLILDDSDRPGACSTDEEAAGCRTIAIWIGGYPPHYICRCPILTS